MAPLLVLRHFIARREQYSPCCSSMTTHNSCSLAIIGDGSVGKSTIINAFKTDGFQPVYKQTIGCDFFEKQLTLRSHQLISLRVWDIGGQSIHSKNLEAYLTPANAIMLVYDVTNQESFDNLSDWLMQLRKYNQTKHVYLMGNKVDMISLRQVSQHKHDVFLEENQLHGGAFCSAKTGENVVKMFYKVAGDIIGVKLTEFELAVHDKVLKAHIQSSTDEEARNPWADEIENEDLEAERRKKQQGCACIIA
ncbi:GTP-binding protein [archaeon]|nr:MAG: GTP-binding protein [archaeon]